MNISAFSTRRGRSLRGFTIVELTIVIVVIAILASITIVVYRGAQPSARDTKRVADLHAIAEAIQLYRQKYGNDIQGGSGCGSGGGGSGWFNYAGGSYPNSTLSCLTNAGYLDSGSQFVDPSGCTTNGNNASGSPVGYCHTIDGNYGYTYMKYSSGTPPNQVTCLYARMETTDDTAALKAASSPCHAAGSTTVAGYGMNYQLLVK